MPVSIFEDLPLLFGEVVFHALWMGALLFVLCRLLLWWMRSWSASLRYRLLLLGFGMVIVMPLLFTAGHYYQHVEQVKARGQDGAYASVFINTEISFAKSFSELGVENPELAAEAEATAAMTQSLSWRTFANRAIDYLFWMWLIGLGFLGVRLLVGWRHLYQFRRHVGQPASDEWQHRTDELAAQLGLQQRVGLYASSWIDAPIVFGWRQPRILAPATLLAQLDRPKAEMIIAHELAHIRHHDFLANVLQSVAETLFFFNPAVWWFSRRLREEREYRCDEVVVQLTANKGQYARALFDTEQLRQTPAFALSAGSSPLAKRIRRILSGQPLASTVKRQAVVLGMAALPVLLFVVLAFRSPLPSWQYSASDVPSQSGVLEFFHFYEDSTAFEYERYHTADDTEQTHFLATNGRFFLQLTQRGSLQLADDGLTLLGISDDGYIDFHFRHRGEDVWERLDNSNLSRLERDTTLREFFQYYLFESGTNSMLWVSDRLRQNALDDVWGTLDWLRYGGAHLKVYMALIHSEATASRHWCPIIEQLKQRFEDNPAMLARYLSEIEVRLEREELALPDCWEGI